MRAVAAAVSMFVGGMLYIVLRSESLVMFKWLEAIGLRDEVQALRFLASTHLEFFPRWTYFSLPQALWYFSGLLIFDVIWPPGANSRWQRRAWLLLFSGVALGMELGQATHLLSGRVDFVDVILLIAAFCVFTSIGYVRRCRATAASIY